MAGTPARRYYKVRGLVARAGVPQPGRAVVCYRGWGQPQDRKLTDRAGRFEFDVDPASYEILVMPEVGRTRDLTKYRVPVSVHAFLVSARAHAKVTDEDVEVRLHLPTKAIVVRVRDAETMAPIGNATVHWESSPMTMQELIVPADASGYVRIADVPPGRHQVLAGARCYKSFSDVLTIEKDGPDAVVELLLKPTCAADIVLLDANRKLVSISAAQKGSLVHLESGEIIAAKGPSQRVWPRPSCLSFNSLEPGRYEASIGGDEHGRDGEVRTVRHAPCISLGKSIEVIELRKGQLQRAEVSVAQRSYATLRVLDRAGQLLDGTLHVTHVDDDGVVVRSLPAPWQYGDRHGSSHFEGYLPRARYMLTFISANRTWHGELVVDEATVDREITPNW